MARTAKTRVAAPHVQAGRPGAWPARSCRRAPRSAGGRRVGPKPRHHSRTRPARRHASHHGGEGLGAHGEELGAVVERRRADAARGQPASGRTALVEHARRRARRPARARAAMRPASPAPTTPTRIRLAGRQRPARCHPGQELEHDPVEGRGMLDHQAVGGAGDHHQLGAGDQLGQLLAVAPRGEDVLVARPRPASAPSSDGRTYRPARRCVSTMARTWAAKACGGSAHGQGPEPSRAPARSAGPTEAPPPSASPAWPSRPCRARWRWPPTRLRSSRRHGWCGTPCRPAPATGPARGGARRRPGRWHHPSTRR